MRSTARFECRCYASSDLDRSPFSDRLGLCARRGAGLGEKLGDVAGRSDEVGRLRALRIARNFERKQNGKQLLNPQPKTGDATRSGGQKMGGEKWRSEKIIKIMRRRGDGTTDEYS